MLYGSDFRLAFDAFWDYAKRNYNPIRDGKVTGSVTMYYDPLVPCHHPVGDSYNFQSARRTLCCRCTPATPVCCTTTPSAA